MNKIKLSNCELKKSEESIHDKELYDMYLKLKEQFGDMK